jgi:L-seryl-tRNA(Ser) seleniumtransferase
MTYAALESVLRLYRDPERLAETLPTLRLLSRPLEEIEQVAKEVLRVLDGALAGAARAQMIPCCTQIGSGSLPVDLLPSVCIAVTPLVRGKGEGTALKRIEQAFRNLPVPVIGRITENAFCMDMRCLEEKFMGELLGQLDQLRLGGGKSAT